MVTFANSLASDQARQNVGPDLDPNCLPLVIFEIIFFIVDFEKNLADIKKVYKNIPVGKELKIACNVCFRWSIRGMVS